MSASFGDLTRPPLSAKALRASLVRDDSRWREVTVVAEVGSTNADLAAMAHRGPVDGVVLVAELQVAGRGRLDRTWSAPSRSALTFSALVRPAGVPVARWTWLPLVAGLAVAAAVDQIANVAARLKWPNDVVVADRKLAGLLVERIETPSGPAAVVGIGLNVTATRAELPTQRATSLALEGASTTDRTVLLKAVLRRLDGLLQEWESTAGEPSQALREAYTGACVTIGARVRVELPGGVAVVGEGVGVDDSGRLRVQTADGLCTIGAGDVVHVRNEP